MRLRSGVVAVIGVLLLSACTDEPAARRSTGPSFAAGAAQAARTYVVIGSDNALPADFASRVAAAGGSVSNALDAIGVAVVSSEDPSFAAALRGSEGIDAVAEDVMIDFGMPHVAGEEVADFGEPVLGDAAHIGAVETFRGVQWAPDAISAPAAWDLGHQGAGARVAILDGGIRNTHIDIAPNLDVARSASFVPGQPYNFDQARNALGQCVLNDTFWHGTHVAGIVGAPANNIGTVGIAPQATLIGVKVLHCGSGSFSWIMQGIYYAATPITEGGAGAHIINMSLGGRVVKNANTESLLSALSRATSYARQRGVTVIAAAGNDTTDIDHTRNLVFVPAQSVGVISVSATAPRGWGIGPANLDVPTLYTNFGQSAITLAGPGGGSALAGTPAGNGVCVKPRFPSGSVAQLCWVLDLVMSTCRGSGTSNSTYCWAAGTSMAAPAVAGVAALIIGKHGPMHPAQVEAILRQSADDLGKPGNDDFYGRGRVNALRAVQ